MLDSIGQLKEEEKARLKAEYEVYELKRTLQKELLKQEEIVKSSQEQILRLHHESSKSKLEQNPPPSETKSETFKKLLDDIDRKESIIAALDQKLVKLSEELDKERDKSRALEDTIRSLTESISAKDNESSLCSRRVEELIEKKNRLQREYSGLRDENKALIQANSALEKECEDFKKQIGKIQEDSRGKTEELRNSLKKNSSLLKQVAVFFYMEVGQDLEKENKRVTELLNSQNERMNALRTVNKQLEAKSEDIKQKCTELAYLQEHCAELETKCQEQAKLIQLSEIERIKITSSQGFEQELSKKYCTRQRYIKLCRNLEIAKLNQELQLLKEDMQQMMEGGNKDKLASIGSMRKDKELRQLQGECELLKAEVERLREENDRIKRENLPRAIREDFHEFNMEEDKERGIEEASPERQIAREAEGDLGASLGNSTLKSSLSELTKSQKLIIENVLFTNNYQ
eukprot:TRINITY_DN2996_c0_g1_i1.p3 TRINITY_DN2996_c0_g1~~TRINITY_DN2996_c0_g1_i1.p3  ORF type:complete len:460 (+),score=95.96 TRINITY_DN2996_c0_g1_i1:1555-2934(+)